MYLGRTIEGINPRGTDHSTAAVTLQAAVRSGGLDLGGKGSDVAFVDMGKRCCEEAGEKKSIPICAPVYWFVHPLPNAETFSFYFLSDRHQGTKRQTLATVLSVRLPRVHPVGGMPLIMPHVVVRCPWFRLFPVGWI